LFGFFRFFVFYSFLFSFFSPLRRLLSFHHIVLYVKVMSYVLYKINIHFYRGRSGFTYQY
jgi:hypothetical protein